LAAVAAMLATAHSVRADPCNRPGGDIITGDVIQVLNTTSQGGIEAVTFGTMACNMGDQPLDWFASTTQHPVTTSSLFRLQTIDSVSRFEQVGIGWVAHEFFALSQATCCTDCQPTNGQALGVRCSSPLGASYQSFHANLAPRFDINAFTGEFPFPPSNPPIVGSIARRVQVAIADLDPRQNGGGSYFVESMYVHPDEAGWGNQFNNASWRPVVVSGTGDAWNLALSGAATREQPAIYAWKSAVPSVMLAEQIVPGEGLFIVGANVTEIAPGQWHYEYAVENINSDRSARSFRVPLPPGSGASQIGFHDVTYHDGDGAGGQDVDGTDWASNVIGPELVWQTQTWEENINANALRWGTLYNFRFVTTTAPVEGDVTLGLFKPSPSLDAPVPNSIAVRTLVPAAATIVCPADCAQPPDGQVDVSDLLALLAEWDAPGPSCNILEDATVNVLDLLELLAAWGACE
jgi:hypothetical protein